MPLQPNQCPYLYLNLHHPCLVMLAAAACGRCSGIAGRVFKCSGLDKAGPGNPSICKHLPPGLVEFIDQVGFESIAGRRNVGSIRVGAE